MVSREMMYGFERKEEEKSSTVRVIKKKSLMKLYVPVNRLPASP